MPRSYQLIQKIKSLRRLWKSIQIIIVSLIIASIVLFIIEASYSAKVVTPFENNTFDVKTEFEYFTANTAIIPGYFSSTAHAYAFIYSPFADIFNFTMEISRDNSTWVKVPFIKSDSQPQDYNQFTDLGYFTIDKPTTIVIYGRYITPPQNVTLPENVTPTIICDSVHGQIMLIKDSTPRDQALELLVFITLFSLSLTIIRLLRDEWNKNEPVKNPLEIIQGPC